MKTRPTRMPWTAWKFWLKTALYRLTPGGFGYYRRLRQYRDPKFNIQRDSPSLRLKHSQGQGWQPVTTPEGFTYRNYTDYEEYLAHQKLKLDEVLKATVGFTNAVVASYRYKFFRRFWYLRQLLPASASIICAGARQGTEVEVLRDLGFQAACGIDLNPGPQNPWVRPGDFMHMENSTGSVDLVYTNCVDHAFNLDQFFAEHARVIKDTGYVMYDLTLSETAGSFEAVQWKEDETIFLLMLKYFKTVVKVESEPGWKWILLQGKRA